MTSRTRRLDSLPRFGEEAFPRRAIFWQTGRQLSRQRNVADRDFEFAQDLLGLWPFGEMSDHETTVDFRLVGVLGCEVFF